MRSGSSVTGRRSTWSGLIASVRPVRPRLPGFRTWSSTYPTWTAQALSRQIDLLGPYRRRPLHRFELYRLKQYERSLTTRYAGVVVCKDDDVDCIGTDRAAVSVVPNGVTKIDSPSASSHEQPQTLLFVGSLDYRPNIDASLFFFDRVLPAIRAHVPHVKVVIAGKAAGKRLRDAAARAGCSVISPVDDLRPSYDEATVVIVPLTWGAGTRLKILEALSLGKAVVSTSVGAEGLSLTRGSDLLVADTPAEFADACSRLIEDPAARRRLGEAGRATVNSRHTWDVVAPALESALELATERAAAHRGMQ